MVVQHNQRGTWRCPVRAPSDEPLGGHCSNTTELASSEPTIDIPPHLSQHAKGICEKERFWLEEPRKEVRRFDTARP